LLAKTQWTAVLGVLEVELGGGQFSAWLSDSQLIGGDASTITIGVRNAFTREVADRSFRSNIERAVERVAGCKLGVTFVVAPRGSASAASKAALPVNPIEPAGQALEQPLRLYDQFTFESFVVGAANRLAHAAALQVAQNPGASYNPLFVWGGVGLGKTHLLHAIATEARRAHPNAEPSILLVTSERFTNDLVSAIANGSTARLRDKYRSVDILLIDDIQFVAGREATQEELFHTFDALHNKGLQLVLASDRPPSDIQPLTDRLTTRFASGLVVDIQAPELEARQAFLQAKSSSLGLELAPDILTCIAELSPPTFRDLAGSLTRIAAEVSISSLPVTEPSIRSLLESQFSTPCSTNTPDKIIAATTQHLGVARDAILGPSRARHIVHARHLAMYLLREDASLSLPAIGRFFGGRDHTSALHACRKIHSSLPSQPNLRQELSTIRSLLIRH
tara:strand:+ start:554 stop:1903 length:1350 start_codon:yes stop_codon:yes gene_type:complete